MRYIFKFPDIGEGLEEGTIVEWHVEKGQSVKMGDPLVTMETDKVVTAIPSPKNGVIAAKYGKVGEIIHVGSALVEIDIESTEEQAKTQPVEEEGAGVVGTLEVAGNDLILSASKEGVAPVDNQRKRDKALATPVARAMAKELNIDINSVLGTGPGGRVTKEDIQKFFSGNSTSKAPAIQKEESLVDNRERIEVVQMSQIRKTIAKNMIMSKHNAAHMTVFEEAEISELIKIRERYKKSYADEGIKLTYLAFVVKAVAKALKKHRSLNSQMDMEAGNIIYKNYYNIGIAIDAPKGLIVPVIRDADTLSIREIASEITDISQKAREGKTSLDDMKDGTFTITSYGSIGGLFAVPVINYPQAAILGIGRVFEKPIVQNSNITIGNIMPLSLSVDHRIADGGETARFINCVMGYLNDPVSLILD